MGHGVFGEAGGGVQPELFRDARFMEFDCFDRDAEDRCDFFERSALCDQLQHLALTEGE